MELLQFYYSASRTGDLADRCSMTEWLHRQFSMSVIAFHEKAGRSQVGSFVFSLDKLFSPCRVATVATLPSALLMERFRSLGASWVFSFQPVLPPDCRPFVHPSMEVGQAINAVTETRLFLSINL